MTVPRCVCGHYATQHDEAKPAMPCRHKRCECRAYIRNRGE